MGNEPLSELFYRWLAWRLPRNLVKWCALRLMAHATFVHRDMTPTDINMLDALSDWSIPLHPDREPRVASVEYGPLQED
jgi:hypothetical protein